MRIAFTTPEYVTSRRCEGGLANYLKKTAHSLAERGCDVWVFVLSDQNNLWSDGKVTICEVASSNIFNMSISKKIPYINLIYQALSQKLNSRKLAEKFWAVHCQKPFDIIHASSYKATGYSLLKNCRVPVVCRVSSYTPIVRSAYGYRRGLAEYLSDWLELRQVADADAVFAPSSLTARYFELVEGIKLNVIRTQPESLQIDMDNSFFEAHRPSGRFLLYFGTLSRIKGADLLAEALPSIFAKYSDVSCIFIGRDDGLPSGEKLFPFIKTRCGEFSSRLSYFSPLDKSKLFPFIFHSEAVLIPSRVDNCPNACLEAQMFGKPVIGTYESSLDEMVVDGETGFLARNDDPVSIQNAIDRYLCLAEDAKMTMRQKILDHLGSIDNEDRIGKLLVFYKDTMDRFVTHGRYTQ